MTVDTPEKTGVEKPVDTRSFLQWLASKPRALVTPLLTIFIVGGVILWIGRYSPTPSNLYANLVGAIVIMQAIGLGYDYEWRNLGSRPTTKQFVLRVIVEVGSALFFLTVMGWLRP